MAHEAAYADIGQKQIEIGGKNSGQNAVTYRPRLSQLASTALIQARIVSDNILGISSSYSCV